MMIKRWGALLCVLLLTLSIAGCSHSPTSDSNQESSQMESTGDNLPTAGKKVAYIMQMSASDIFLRWSQSAQQTAEALGMEYDAFFCDGSDEQWRETVTQCAADGYDGLLLSHGGQDYAYTFLRDLLEEYPQLKIVTFDTLFLDEAGQPQTLDGVTQFFQQDTQLAELSLDYVCHTLYPDKVASGEPVNILKVWVGDYLAAFDRREEGYKRYEEEGLIHTVETIGPADLSDAKTSMAQVTAAALARYEPGEIDAIWCCYDLYAQGVYSALTQGGYYIPLVSVDLSNADMEMMAQDSSPWKACATTNWDCNGEFGIRVLALELTEEYEAIIDPATGETSAWLELPASIITQNMVSDGGIDLSNLSTVAGKDYTDRSWMPTSDWMPSQLDEK